MREHHGVILVEPSEIDPDIVEEIEKAIKRTVSKTVACVDRLKTLDYLPLEPLRTDLSISFGGVKITGFADAAYIRYDDGELRRRRNKRKRRSRKQRGK